MSLWENSYRHQGQQITMGDLTIIVDIDLIMTGIMFIHYKVFSSWEMAEAKLRTLNAWVINTCSIIIYSN